MHYWILVHHFWSYFLKGTYRKQRLKNTNTSKSIFHIGDIKMITTICSLRWASKSMSKQTHVVYSYFHSVALIPDTFIPLTYNCLLWFLLMNHSSEAYVNIGMNSQLCTFIFFITLLIYKCEIVSRVYFGSLIWLCFNFFMLCVMILCM